MKAFLQKQFVVVSAVLTLFFCCSCATTRIVTSPDSADAVNVVSDTTVCHYFWGLRKAKDINPHCDPRYNSLTKVTVRTKPHHVIVTVFTLGIVIPQNISWSCTPPPTEPGELGTN